jgi:CDP-diacylglycerol--serine O-phosphatidyltransferase
MVFDGLDGRIARMTNSSSAFGAEYDSLADMVSFGLAPALLLYQWALSDFGKLGWLIAFVYTAGAALRLARFNTQVGVADKRYFQGLPSPAAAALLAGLVWMVESNQFDTGIESSAALILTFAAGLLMVSNIRFSSFKELNLKDKVPFVTLLVVVLVLVVITIKPSVILFAIAFSYAVSGLVLTLYSLHKTRQLRKRNKAESKVENHSESESVDNSPNAPQLKENENESPKI